jgi:tRNA (mo5U34)-methyltransferase
MARSPVSKARRVQRLVGDPRRAFNVLRDRVERALAQWPSQVSLRKLCIPREPYSDIDKQIMAIHWVHRITLPGGRVTPGDWDTDKALSRLRLPEDLSGKTVLDVGAWDGLYSFEAEKRGAARVLATDHFCWSGDGWGTRDGFDLAHRLLGSKVEPRDIDIPDLSPESVGIFDVVLFLGVLYHLKDPLSALERVASVTRDLLILETLVDLTFMRQPALSFHRGRSQPFSLYRHWRRDPTTWFAPNEAAVVTMLEHVGFRKTVRVFPPVALWSRCLHLMNAAIPFFSVQKNFRMVFHAWK